MGWCHWWSFDYLNVQSQSCSRSVTQGALLVFYLTNPAWSWDSYWMKSKGRSTSIPAVHPIYSKKSIGISPGAPKLRPGTGTELEIINFSKDLVTISIMNVWWLFIMMKDLTTFYSHVKIYGKYFYLFWSSWKTWWLFSSWWEWETAGRRSNCFQGSFLQVYNNLLSR